MTFEEQIQDALGVVRPLLARHSGNITVVKIDEQARDVTLKFEGTCKGCPLAHITLKMGVEQVLFERVPTLHAVHLAGTSDLP